MDNQSSIDTRTISPLSNSAPFLPTNVSEPCERRWHHHRQIKAGGFQEKECLACETDVVYWVQNWVWTYDPRLEGEKTIPLDPWPKQIEFLRWLEDRQRNKEGGLAEKSRDFGMSYLCCAFAVHRWLFEPGVSIGFGSRKEIYVDRAGDPDSLFEKLRIIIDGLPPWMRPRGYDRFKHATFSKIVNPEHGATITGEAGDGIGRGGRKSIYFVDEAAYIERAGMLDQSLSATTEVRIDISTPNGIGNPFYVKRFGGRVPVFTAHWRDDPRKSEAWAAKKKAEIGPIAWAQEYEIDYSASLEGVCIPAAWVRAAVNLKLPVTSHPTKTAGYDIAEEGNDSNVFIVGDGPVVQEIESWGQQTTTQSAYKVVELAKKRYALTVNYDVVGVGTGPKGIWLAMSDNDKRLHENGPVIDFVAINTGETPTDAVWPDGKTSKEKFENLKAEAWWTLRTRFERTYEHVEGINTYPPDELISIPDHPQLIAEISTPKVEYTDKGKVRIESKKQLRARGVKSPDFAEALVLLFCPKRPELTFWVLA